MTFSKRTAVAGLVLTLFTGSGYGMESMMENFTKGLGISINQITLKIEGGVASLVGCLEYGVEAPLPRDVIAKVAVLDSLPQGLERNVIVVEEDAKPAVVSHLESSVGLGFAPTTSVSLLQTVVEQRSAVVSGAAKESAKDVLVSIAEEQPLVVSVRIEVVAPLAQKVHEEEKEESRSQKEKASSPNDAQPEGVKNKSSRGFFGFFYNIGSGTYGFFASCFSGVWNFFCPRKDK